MPVDALPDAGGNGGPGCRVEGCGFLCALPWESRNVPPGVQCAEKFQWMSCYGVLRSCVRQGVEPCRSTEMGVSEKPGTLI